MSQEFYNKTAKNYDKRHDNPTTEHIRKIESYIISIYAFGKILDIGCGTGFHLKNLKNAIGVDVSEEMTNKIPNTMKASAENLPFPDSYFDSTICMLSVLNLCDHEKSVREMNRVLRPGGIAIVSVSSVWDKKNANIFTRMKSHKPIKKNVRIEKQRLILHLFTKDQLIDLFKNNGFELQRFDGLFITQQPYWGWYREFSRFEKMKLKLDAILPKRAARFYIAVFKKK